MVCGPMIVTRLFSLTFALPPEVPKMGATQTTWARGAYDDRKGNKHAC